MWGQYYIWKIRLFKLIMDPHFIWFTLRATLLGNGYLLGKALNGQAGLLALFLMK